MTTAHRIPSKLYRAPRALWAEARVMWEAGESTADIARHVGLSDAAVYWHRIADGWPPRDTRRDWEMARTMWDRNERPDAICAALGITQSSLYRAVARYTWPKRCLKGPESKSPKVHTPKPRGMAPIVVDRASGEACPCGSEISRLVLVEGVYVHRCVTCVPEWWSTRRMA